MKNNNTIGDQIGEMLEQIYKAKDTIINVIEGSIMVIIVFATLFLLLLKFCW